MIAGIPATVIHVPYSNNMGFKARVRAFLRFAVLASREAMRQQADVVLATSTPLTIAVPGIAAKIRWGIPMVFEVRDLWPELPIAVGALRNPLLQQVARSLEWLAYHASSHVVALSPGMAEGVIRRGVPRSRVTVIPNSCDVDLFDVPAQRGHAIRRRLPNLTIEHPLIVYTGTFGLINGVDYLVDVAAAMRTVDPDVRFLLVGDGAEATKMITRAQDLEVLNNNLWVWKPLPKQEMPDLLAAATVATSLFVPLQSMWNNSANKFFDALAAGKPVAINYGGWQAELLEQNHAGIVLPPHDPVQAAHMLASFVRDPQRLQQAGAAVRMLAHTTFHRDVSARKLETVLNQVVDKHHGAKKHVSQ